MGIISGFDGKIFDVIFTLFYIYWEADSGQNLVIHLQDLFKYKCFIILHPSFGRDYKSSLYYFKFNIYTTEVNNKQ